MKLRRGTNSLSRWERLRGSKDYSRIFREGDRARLPGLTVRWVKNSLPYSRIGTSVGRRFGNAVARNRAKRLLRELYRTRKRSFPSGFDIVFMPGRNFLHKSWPQLEQTIEKAAERINIALASRHKRNKF